ncbi:hypothetical protein K466DRAFT_496212 [Polyporus arcularius HHB13444]|uniref:BTB domain-containing protein n=1 Tax=Polyporus arcularius HHB13444 TaxID=1314778 RepID=A0A5C3P7U5_9APHY|nr:hypothetical protein K466DRAFT_496212 [Polyporus arcularius HHB13444]
MESTRDADIWFEDGNVAILAGYTVFRVHKGQLSRHSDIFDGLFRIPQAPASDIAPSLGIVDSMEGCPIVTVSDTAFDFKHLLHALYDSAEYLNPMVDIPFYVLAALARMAHKYQVDWLLAEATRRLKTAFSDQFTMWPGDLSTSCVSLQDNDAVEAFNLFRRIDRLDMLPAAFYACCQMDLSDLVHGVIHVTGAVVEKLDVDDLERCLKARREMKESHVKLALTLFRDPLSPTCPTEKRCGDVCGDCHSCDMEEYYFVADANILGPHFSEYIESYMEDDPAFCDGCAQMLKDRDLAARLSAWRSLPGYAGVSVQGWGSAQAKTVNADGL